jgi:hypothetical protein
MSIPGGSFPHLYHFIFSALQKHTTSHISTFVYRALDAYDGQLCILMDVKGQLLSRPFRAGIYEAGKGEDNKTRIVG